MNCHHSTIGGIGDICGKLATHFFTIENRYYHAHCDYHWNLLLHGSRTHWSEVSKISEEEFIAHQVIES